MSLKYILLSSTSEREDMLRDCIQSLNQYAEGWSLVLVLQGYDEVPEFDIKLPHAIASEPEPLGMHNAKVMGLDYIAHHADGRRYVVCSMDDDMLFIEGTNLEAGLDKAMELETGFVSLGWVANETKLKKHKVVDEYVKQKIVYTGGGLLFKDYVAEIIRQIPRRDYLCDNSLWSTCAYVSGLTNYRYRGSVAIHKVCQKGGLRLWTGKAKRDLGPQQYLTFKRGHPKFDRNNCNNYLIPDDACLTDLAHKEHRENVKIWQKPDSLVEGQKQA